MKKISAAGGNSVPHASSKPSQPTLPAVSNIPAPFPPKFTINELNDDDESGCNDFACDGGEIPSCDRSGEDVDRTDTIRSKTSTPVPRLSPSEHGGDDESHPDDYEFNSGDSPGCDWSGEDGVIVHYNNTENGGGRKRRRPNKTTGTRRPNPEGNERGSLSDGEDGDEDGAGEGDRPQNPKPGNEGPDSYGCPYYKREPEKYPKCASCRFPSNRVRDVKFHVLRTHLKPEQCPRGCGYRDGTVALIWKHLKETNCEKATLVELPDDIVKDGKALNPTQLKPTSWEHICMTIFKCPKSRVPVPDFVEHQENADSDKDQGSGHIPDPGSEEQPTRDRAEGIRQAAPPTQSDMLQSTVKDLEAKVQHLSEQLQQVHTFLSTNLQPQRPDTSTNNIYTQASSRQGPERGSDAPNDTDPHISIAGSGPQPATSVSSIAGTSSGPSYDNGQHEHPSRPPMDSGGYNPYFPYVIPERDPHTHHPSTSMNGGPILSFANELAASHPTNNVLLSGPVPHYLRHFQESAGLERNSWPQDIPQTTSYPTNFQTLDSQPFSQ